MDKHARRLKIFHGPVNIGGIGWRLSRLQRADGYQSDFWTLGEHPRKKDADVCLQAQSRSVLGRLAAMVCLFFFALGNYKIFHFYSGVSLLPWGVDLPVLRVFGKRVVMTYVGSEVRLYTIDATRHSHPHLLHEAGYTPEADRRRRRRLRWHSWWCHRATAPRNLYAFVRTTFPERRISTCWVNNLDIDMPDKPPPFREAPGRRLLVVHAPTSQRVKGTAYIERAIERLREQGCDFEYRRLENLTHDQAQQALCEADIVVDQLVVGGIGNLSLEAMALGKTLVTYVYDDILRALDDPPLVNADVQTLEPKLREVMADMELRRWLHAQGPPFVRRHINPRTIADEIYRLYGIDPPTGARSRATERDNG